MVAHHLFRRLFVVLTALFLVCGAASAAETPAEIEAKIEGFPSWLEIDLDALGANLEQIRKRTGAEVMPVVKNNAYGHGLIPITSYLISKGVTRVFVAKLETQGSNARSSTWVLCFPRINTRKQWIWRSLKRFLLKKRRGGSARRQRPPGKMRVCSS